MKTEVIQGFRTTAEIGISIADGPVQNQAYSAQGRRVLVDHIGITYTYDPEHETWFVRRHHDIIVSGRTVRKDGTPGTATHRRNPLSANGIRFPFAAAAGWEWVDEIIEQYRPTGTIQFKEQ